MRLRASPLLMHTGGIVEIEIEIEVAGRVEVAGRRVDNSVDLHLTTGQPPAPDTVCAQGPPPTTAPGVTDGPAGRLRSAPVAVDTAAPSATTGP